MTEALALGLAACLAGGLLLWLWSLARRDAGVADVGWGLYFLLLAGLARAGGPPARPFHLLHLALVAVWGVRLALHIALRARGRPEDPRYAAMRARHGDRFPRVSLFSVFLLQAALAALLAAPLVAVQRAGSVHGTLFAIGVALFCAGFLFEAVADAQLARFRADPASGGRVLDRGLWRWSRHPNYFGEAVLGWGFGAMGAAAGQPLTLLAPLGMTWLLLRVSGVTLLESTIGERRPGYAEYVARTSAFLPRPPRS